MDDPVDKFQSWWQDALRESPLRQKNAVCVSTIDERGFPAARFVDLKSVDDDGFVFCTYLNSAKGRQIQSNPRTALTIWWDHVGYQVRVVGMAEAVDDAEADRFWATRSRSARLATVALKQSMILASEEELALRVKETSREFEDCEVSRPTDWGGYRVKPVAIEFLTFRDDRLHLRELYEKTDGGWSKRLLQP